MGSVAFKEQPRAITLAGVLLPIGSITFVDADTAEPLAVYADPELLTPLANPLPSDGAARFPPFWLDPEASYRATLNRPNGDEVWDLDPVTLFPSTYPVIPLDNAGEFMPFAVLTFWRGDTTQLATVYADANLLTPADNPATADSSGEFTPLFLDDEQRYRVKLARADGVLVYDVDNFAFLADPPAPPSAPVLSGELGADFTHSLTWTEPFSFFPIAGYRLYDADTLDLVTDVDALAYLSGYLGPSFTRAYFVVAYDDFDQESPHSNTVELTTDATGTVTDIFTSNGTWAKRTGLVSADISVIAGGGGAGNGHIQFISGDGGSGGGGGERRRMVGALAADLPSSAAVVVGAGGAGAPQQSYDPSLGGFFTGLAGVDGNDSSFGALITAKGGHKGTVVNAGGSAGGLGGHDGTGGTGTNGTNGGYAAGENTVGDAGPGIAAVSDEPTGGGGGGAWHGSLGGVLYEAGAGGLSGSTPGGNAAAGVGLSGGSGNSTTHYAGTGGGGGGGNIDDIPGAGGGGANYGSGGGGGGGTAFTGFSPGIYFNGAGGDGRQGVVVVVNYIEA